MKYEFETIISIAVVDQSLIRLRNSLVGNVGSRRRGQLYLLGSFYNQGSLLRTHNLEEKRNFRITDLRGVPVTKNDDFAFFEAKYLEYDTYIHM